MSHVKIDAAGEMTTNGGQGSATIRSGGITFWLPQKANLLMQDQKIGSNLVDLKLTYLSLLSKAFCLP